MRSLDINFATVPFRNNTPYYLGYVAGALLIAGFTAFNGWAYMAYSQSRAELESDHAAQRVRLEALYRDAARIQDAIKKKNIPALNSRAAFTNGLLERRRFSWTGLLNALEEVQPYQVRLQSLIPRIQEKGILIESRGVARDLKAYWNFQQNLQNHPKFRRAYPGGYLHNSDAGEYVFNLSFNYFPEGAPMDVQGLTPEVAGITQAPGEGPSSAPSIEEDPPPPEPSPKNSRVKPPPKTATAPPASSSKTSAPPSAQKNGPPVGTPPGVQVPPPVNPNPQIAADPPGGRGAAAFQNPTSDLATAMAGGAQPAQPVDPNNPNPNPNANGNPNRWHGRGLMPGSGGKRPPAAKKPEGLPTINVPQKPNPDDDDKDEGEGDNQ